MATVTGGTHSAPAGRPAPTGAGHTPAPYRGNGVFTENAASATDSTAAHGRAADRTTAGQRQPAHVIGKKRVEDGAGRGTTGHRPRQARQPAAASDRGNAAGVL